MRIRTDEHNKKISEAMKGKKHSSETKKKISDSLRGNQNARKEKIDER